MAAVDIIANPASTNSFVNPVDGPFIRFPPFPEPPEGTTVMSFKQFKERGICIEPGPDDAEVDALGIPTIPFPKRHDTDMCKTNTKRKRKAEEATARKKAGVLPARIIWWEQWEETEMIRFSHGFNPNSSRFERVHAAAGDFTTGRTWPVHFASETGPRYIWDRFLRYIGIPEGNIAPKETKKGKAEQKNKDDDISDDDTDEDEEGEGDADEPTPLAGPNVINDRDLPVLIAKNKAAASNEEKLAKFLDNPEKSIRVFLTSYARAQGYIWSDENLACMPRLILFFVNFLLRSKVLPEVERSLRRAVDVLKIAQIELPNTSGIAKGLPDRFSLACNVIWGNKADGYVMLDVEADPKVSEDTPAPDPKVQDEKPVAQLTEVKDYSSDWEQVSAHNWNAPKDETPWANDDLEDKAAPWGDSESNAWINEETISDDAANAWVSNKNDNLPELLGLTGFSSTHRTGIVETSMRRIKSIVGPNPNPPPKPSLAEGTSGPDADSIEIDLDAKYTKVVLAPMPVDWDRGECPVYSRPEILQTSQGAVVEPGTEIHAGTTPKPYDPLNDDITFLVESDEAKVALLRVGMSLGGTWVQIVRQGEAAKKKKKGKSKKAATVYWYLDEMAVITPSFWTVALSDESD